VAHCETEDFENADSDPDVAPSLTISIQGRRQKVTAEEILTMPAEQYALLWTVSSQLHILCNSRSLFCMGLIYLTVYLIDCFSWLSGSRLCTATMHECVSWLWLQAYTTELKSCLQLCANPGIPADGSRLNQLTFEAIMLRDNWLKTDVNSARFMSSEPASFFAQLLVRPLGIHKNAFRAVCMLLLLLLHLLHCIMSEQQLVLQHAFAYIDVSVRPKGIKTYWAEFGLHCASNAQTGSGLMQQRHGFSAHMILLAEMRDALCHLPSHLCWATADFAELVRRPGPGPDVAAPLVHCEAVSSGITASKASSQNAEAKPRSYLWCFEGIFCCYSTGQQCCSGSAAFS